MDAVQHRAIDVQRPQALHVQDGLAIVERLQRTEERIAAGQLEAVGPVRRGGTRIQWKLHGLHGGQGEAQRRREGV